MAGLSDKQEKFVDEYLIDLNATQAAKRAGYSEKTAEAQASRLLRNVKVQERIQKRREAAQKRIEIKLDHILDRYARIAMMEASKFMRVDDNGSIYTDFSDANPDDLQLLTFESDGRKGGDLKIKPLDPHKALETLGKHLGLGDKAAQKQTDTLAEALIAISKRGSAAPIATAQAKDDT